MFQCTNLKLEGIFHYALLPHESLQLTQLNNQLAALQFATFFLHMHTTYNHTSGAEKQCWRQPATGKMANRPEVFNVVRSHQVATQHKIAQTWATHSCSNLCCTNTYSRLTLLPLEFVKQVDRKCLKTFPLAWYHIWSCLDNRRVLKTAPVCKFSLPNVNFIKLQP